MEEFFGEIDSITGYYKIVPRRRITKEDGEEIKRQTGANKVGFIPIVNGQGWMGLYVSRVVAPKEFPLSLKLSEIESRLYALKGDQTFISFKNAGVVVRTCTDNKAYVEGLGLTFIDNYTVPG